MSQYKIAMIVGSLRKDSFNRKLADAIAKLAPAEFSFTSVPIDDLPLYNTVYELAQKNNDTQSLDLLNSIGKPPYAKARNAGQLFRIVKKYEKANSLPAPAGWFVESAAYDNAKDSANRSDGDDYSFVNYVGDQKLQVLPIRSTIDFMKNNTDFKIPVFFIQGEEDLLTPMLLTKKYFEKINAPAKEYILLPKTAHGFNEYVLEAQYKIFKRIKTSG